MATQATIMKDYKYRINNVINYIEAHIADPLSLEDLASVCAFSPYHFHRIFKAVMLENVQQFIRRIRIEKACKLLLFHPERSISDIALDCGLQTSAHFSRVFRSMMGLTASEYRGRYHLATLINRFRSLQTQERMTLIEEKLATLPIEIKSFREQTAVYTRYVGTINDGQVNRTVAANFDYLEEWLRARGTLDCNSMFVGLILDDPYITPGGKHRYDSCITVDRPAASDAEHGVRTIPGGKYAVARFEEKPDLVKDLLHLISVDWLTRSPYIWDIARPHLEIFRGHPLLHPEGKMNVEFCIPIKLK